MKAHTILRGVGVAGVVAAYGVYAVNQPALSLVSLTIAATSIIALISPEVLDQLPFGPNK